MKTTVKQLYEDGFLEGRVYGRFAATVEAQVRRYGYKVAARVASQREANAHPEDIRLAQQAVYWARQEQILGAEPVSTY